MLFTEEPTSAENRVQLRKEWQDLVGGVERSHGVVVVPHGIKMEKAELTPNDMGFLEGMKFNKQEIAAIYGIPPIILGDNSANFATAREEDLIFWQGTMRPLLGKWAGRIDHSVLPEEAFCVFDLSQISVFQQLRWQQSDEVTSVYQSGLITRNEGRVELGYPLAEDSNMFVQPMSLVEVGEGPEPVITRSVKLLDRKVKALQPTLPWYMIRASQLPRKERIQDVEFTEIKDHMKSFVEFVEERLTKEGYPELTA